MVAYPPFCPRIGINWLEGVDGDLPHLDGPVLFMSHMMSSPFRALVRILLL